MTQEEIIDVIRDELARALPSFAAMVAVELARLEREKEQAYLPSDISPEDKQVALMVDRIWRNQGRQPVRTLTFATHAGYGRTRALEILKDAEGNGAITSIRGRGDRHSGRFVPLRAVA